MRVASIVVDRVWIGASDLCESAHRDEPEDELGTSPAAGEQGGTQADRQSLQLDAEQGRDRDMAELMNGNRKCEREDGSEVSQALGGLAPLALYRMWAVRCEKV